jgi:hypothetical protein
MTPVNMEIKNFFQEKIFDLDEDEVDSFLERYDPEEVMHCLSEKLKSVAVSNDTDEPAWRLGRIFGDISKKYKADTTAYSWLDTSNMKGKRSLLNFLSGYWDQSRADLKTLMELATTLENEILAESKWLNELVVAGIDAVAIGYGNNKKFFEEDINVKSNLSEKLSLFREYLSNSPDEKLSRQSLIELLDRV